MRFSSNVFVPCSTKYNKSATSINFSQRCHQVTWLQLVISFNLHAFKIHYALLRKAKCRFQFFILSISSIYWAVQFMSVQKTELYSCSCNRLSLVRRSITSKNRRPLTFLEDNVAFLAFGFKATRLMTLKNTEKKLRKRTKYNDHMKRN